MRQDLRFQQALRRHFLEHNENFIRVHCFYRSF